MSYELSSIIALVLLIDLILMSYVLYRHASICSKQVRQLETTERALTSLQVRAEEELKIFQSYQGLNKIGAFQEVLSEGQKHATTIEQHLVTCDRRLGRVIVPLWQKDLEQLSIRAIWLVQVHLVRFGLNASRLFLLSRLQLTGLEEEIGKLNTILQQLHNGHKILHKHLEQLKAYIDKLHNVISSEQNQQIKMTDWEQMANELAARVTLALDRVTGPVSAQTLHDIAIEYEAIADKAKDLDGELGQVQNQRSKLDQSLNSTAELFQSDVESIEAREYGEFYKPLFDRVRDLMTLAIQQRNERRMVEAQAELAQAQQLREILHLLVKNQPLVDQMRTFTTSKSFGQAQQQIVTYEQILQRALDTPDTAQASALLTDLKKLDGIIERTHTAQTAERKHLEELAQKLHAQLSEQRDTLMKHVVLSDEAGIQGAAACIHGYADGQTTADDTYRWVNTAQRASDEIQQIREHVDALTLQVAQDIKAIAGSLEQAEQRSAKWQVLLDRVEHIRNLQKDALAKQRTLPQSRTISELEEGVQDISRQRTFVSEQLAQIEREYKTQEEADAPVRQDLAVLEKRKWKDEARLDAEAIVRTLRQRLDRLQQERRTARLEHDREQLHNQIIDVLTKLTLQEEVPVMSKTQIINIGNNNTIDSPIIIAESIQESFNVINGSAAPDNIKEQLKRLAVAVSEMSKSLPPDQQENLAQDLQTLSKESVKPNPRRQWWDLSADGLAKAAKNIGAVGKPILEILAMLRPVIEKSFI